MLSVDNLRQLKEFLLLFGLGGERGLPFLQLGFIRLEGCVVGRVIVEPSVAGGGLGSDSVERDGRNERLFRERHVVLGRPRRRGDGEPELRALLHGGEEVGERLFVIEGDGMEKMAVFAIRCSQIVFAVVDVDDVHREGCGTRRIRRDEHDGSGRHLPLPAAGGEIVVQVLVAGRIAEDHGDAFCDRGPIRLLRVAPGAPGGMAGDALDGASGHEGHPEMGVELDAGVLNEASGRVDDQAAAERSPDFLRSWRKRRKVVGEGSVLRELVDAGDDGLDFLLLDLILPFFLLFVLSLFGDSGNLLEPQRRGFAEGVIFSQNVADGLRCGMDHVNSSSSFPGFAKRRR